MKVPKRQQEGNLGTGSRIPSLMGSFSNFDLGSYLVRQFSDFAEILHAPWQWSISVIDQDVEQI